MEDWYIPYGIRLTIIPFSTIDSYFMSYGRIERKEDLYSQRIFGPSKDNECACGNYIGEKYSGTICEKCGVTVHSESSYLRSTRTGHIVLATLCKNPFDEDKYLEAFPVAPINLRMRSDDMNTPTKLGEKYEKLFDYNNQIIKSLPDKNDDSYYYAKYKNKKEEAQHLQELLRDIIGNKSMNTSDIFESDTILGIMNQKLLAADKNVPLYFQLMGFRFFYQGKL